MLFCYFLGLREENIHLGLRSWLTEKNKLIYNYESFAERKISFYKQ